MKRLLFAVFLFGLSMNAHADFITGVIVGSALSSSNNPQEAPRQPVMVRGKSVVCLMDIQKGTCDYQDPQNSRHTYLLPQEFVERRVGKPVKILGSAYMPVPNSYYLVQVVFEYEEK